VTEKVEGTGLVALSPGAKWPAKQWPEQHFARLGGALIEAGLGVLLLGALEERPLLQRVASGISREESVMVAAGDLRLLASLFSIASAAVCNDSGLMHLSAAVDTPTIGIFGPTAPHFGFEPFGGRHRALWLGLDCSPCSLHGEKPCRISEKAPCMHLLDPEEAANSVRRLVGKASAEGGADLFH
jgi:heptosyltransferase-2